MPRPRTYVIQFGLWLLALILWSAAHAGEAGLAPPVLFHLAVLGLAAYAVVRSSLMNTQIALVVGEFLVGVSWAVFTEGTSDDPRHRESSLVICATLVHVATFALGMYVAHLMKKEADETHQAQTASIYEPELAPNLPL